MDNVLEVKNLKISFRTPGGVLKAVRDISFSLKRGETLAIVGESGSGKSVTSKAVLGILAANAIVEGGEIIYDGRDLLKISEEEMCKIRGDRISMIFQDPLSSLDPIVKIGKQITEAMLLKNRAKYKKGEVSRRLTVKEAKEKAIRLMEEVGIPDPVMRYNQYPFEFSGGMRQRIVIAIALAIDPDILICDEPTTALDVTIQAQILELIGRLKRERGLSVVFITHDLGVVANIADRIAVMYAGKIVEIGGCEEVFYEPRHPYTWALLASMPDLNTKTRLEAIPGTPPNMLYPPTPDAFAPRNRYALEIDFELEPPMFEITSTHSAASWLLHPDAPRVEMPRIISERIGKKRTGESKND